MATYLELSWLGLDSTAASSTTTNDPATGALQQEQLAVLNEIYATYLIDGDGNSSAYAVSTTYTRRYAAAIAGSEYQAGDSIELESVFSYASQGFANTWTNVTQGTTLTNPPLLGDINATTGNLITSHTDQRTVTLPGIDPQIQTRVYTYDINSPAVCATDTGWQ